MTEEVNACVLGALEAGAEKLLSMTPTEPCVIFIREITYESRTYSEGAEKTGDDGRD